MKNNLAALFAGAFLLTSAACSTGAEGQEATPAEPSSAPTVAPETTEEPEPPSAPTVAPETTEAPEPTEEPNAPTEAELIAWVEDREGFSQLEDEDPRDYLDQQALRAYDFFCSELYQTALPSDVFSEGLDMPLGSNAIWGDTWDTVEYQPRLRVDATRDIWDMDLRRPIQYEVATTMTCPKYAEAFKTWVESHR